MRGHVFVVQGDLTKFACDAWMIPSDSIGNVTSAFWESEQTALENVGARRDVGDYGTPGMDWKERLAIPLTGKDAKGPRPWLIRSAGEIEEALAGVEAFVKAASEGEKGSSKAEGCRTLMALPLVGTGKGGSAPVAGDLIARLLPRLMELAQEHDVDLALVIINEVHWAAVQAYRKKHANNCWPGLDHKLVSRAMELGKVAAEGNLVVFLGAGVSCGAGLPSWGSLLLEMEADVDLDSNSRKELEVLDFLDRAQLLAKHYRGKSSLGEVVRKAFSQFHRRGLGHTLLASLPVKEFITTNYDELFELASNDVKRPVRVLPFEPAKPGDRWLLKMHGCVTHPDSIVLTRESYLRYADQNAALAGIVQAMLITRKMLFLGFSLKDDNFHRIADAVRRAIHPDPDKPGSGVLGQATMIEGKCNSHLEDLWKDEINLIKVADERAFDIFLDRLCCEAAQPSHLLDRRFKGLLSDSDEALGGLLEPLLNRDGDHRNSIAWPAVKNLLERLGARRDDSA